MHLTVQVQRYIKLLITSDKLSRSSTFDNTPDKVDPNAVVKWNNAINVQSIGIRREFLLKIKHEYFCL